VVDENEHQRHPAKEIEAEIARAGRLGHGR